MTEDTSPAPSFRKRCAILVIGSALLLVAAIIPVAIGQAARELSVERDRRVGHGAEALAVAVADHCAERRDDLRDLADRRPLQVCFENLAHGVAPEAGLDLSLQRAELRLHRFLDEKTRRGRRIYEHVSLIDERGRLLASARAGGFAGRTRSDHRPFPPEGPWIRMAKGPSETVLVGAPCVLNGETVGQVIAAFRPAPAFGGHDPGEIGDVAIVIGPDGEPAVREIGPSRCPLSGVLSTLRPGATHTIEAQEPGRPPVECVARRVEVEGTPLSVILARPVDSAFTRNASALSLLAVVLLAIAGTIAAVAGGRLLASNRALAHERESRDALAQRGQVRIGELEEDLGRLRRSLGALQERAQKYRNLAEMLPQTVFEMDLEGRVTYVNQRGFEQFGYEPRHLEAGLYGLEMLSPADRPAAEKRIKMILAGRKAPPREYTGVRRDGSRFPALVRTSAIVRDGRPVGIRGFLVDLSSGRQVEERLRQSQKMESIGTLAAGLAHDFNNHLTGIQGQTSILLAAPTISDRVREGLEGVGEHVKSAAKLSRQLLEFARSDEGERRVTDLDDLVDRQLRLFRRTHRGLEIRTELAADSWTVEVDRGQIEQVLLNLWVNAAQAMPGGGELRVRTENVSLDPMDLDVQDVPPGDYVRISVSDTGVGMDEPTRRRAFDPFFTTREPGTGTGLGLASAYGIVTKHGGIIDVSSEPGVGTTFRIHLPASHQGGSAAPEPASRIRRGEERVLLVDDETSVRRVGATMLETIGYEVEAVGSGSEALDRLGEQDFDLVILDLVMPGMSGSEAYDRIRKSRPEVRILLSSGYSRDGDAQEILDRGGDGFLQKPFTLRELSNGVRDVLDRSAATVPAG